MDPSRIEYWHILMHSERITRSWSLHSSLSSWYSQIFHKNHLCLKAVKDAPCMQVPWNMLTYANYRVHRFEFKMSKIKAVTLCHSDSGSSRLGLMDFWPGQWFIFYLASFVWVSPGVVWLTTAAYAPMPGWARTVNKRTRLDRSERAMQQLNFMSNLIQSSATDRFSDGMWSIRRYRHRYWLVYILFYPTKLHGLENNLHFYYYWNLI